LTHGDIVSPELDKIGGFVEKLAVAGILSPNRPLETKLLEMANLPPPEESDLEIFDDPTMPTPATSGDLASGILSDTQVATVVKINEAVASGKMPREAAMELLAAALGMSPQEAARFLGSEKPRELPNTSSPGTSSLKPDPEPEEGGPDGAPPG
jgi:hypothetical protein